MCIAYFGIFEPGHHWTNCGHDDAPSRLFLNHFHAHETCRSCQVVRFFFANHQLFYFETLQSASHCARCEATCLVMGMQAAEVCFYAFPSVPARTPFPRPIQRPLFFKQHCMPEACLCPASCPLCTPTHFVRQPTLMHPKCGVVRLSIAGFARQKWDVGLGRDLGQDHDPTGVKFGLGRRHSFLDDLGSSKMVGRVFIQY